MYEHQFFVRVKILSFHYKCVRAFFSIQYLVKHFLNILTFAVSLVSLDIKDQEIPQISEVTNIVESMKYTLVLLIR